MMIFERNKHDAVSIGYQMALLCGPPYPKHPGLRVLDMSPDRQIMLGKAITRLILYSAITGRTLTNSEAYLIALDMYGCNCPHVPSDDAEASCGEVRFRCLHCEAYVIQPFAFPSYWLRPIMPSTKHSK